MIITARQLEDLHKTNGSNGHVVLPYRARLSPLAADWVKARKVVLGYSDADAVARAAPPASPTPSSPFRGRSQNGASPSDAPAPQESTPQGTPGTVLYWCDGPCGPSKAALVAQAKESNLRAIDQPADVKRIIPVIKALAAEIKASRATAGVLVVQNAALAMLFANRCPSLRAVVGTCLEAVEQGIQQAAANVLVIEHPHKTLPQVKTLLGRFVRARRELPEEVRRQLEELAACG